VAVAHGLGFVSLGTERYDLVMRRAALDSPRLRPLLEALHRPATRQAGAAIPGYDVSNMGVVVATSQ